MWTFPAISVYPDCYNLPTIGAIVLSGFKFVTVPGFVVQFDSLTLMGLYCFISSFWLPYSIFAFDLCECKKACGRSYALKISVRFCYLNLCNTSPALLLSSCTWYFPYLLLCLNASSLTFTTLIYYRPCWWRHVPLAGYNNGSHWKSFLWWCVSCINSLSSRLSFQASKGMLPGYVHKLKFIAGVAIYCTYA